MGGDTDHVEFFKNPNEKVIIARPDQFADVRPGSASGGSTVADRGVVVNQNFSVRIDASANVTKDSMAEMRRQAALGARDVLRSINGR